MGNTATRSPAVPGSALAVLRRSPASHRPPEGGRPTARQVGVQTSPKAGTSVVQYMNVSSASRVMKAMAKPSIGELRMQHGQVGRRELVHEQAAFSAVSALCASLLFCYQDFAELVARFHHCLEETPGAQFRGPLTTLTWKQGVLTS